MTAPVTSIGVGLGIPEPTDFIIGDTLRGVIGGTTYTLASGYTTITGDGYSVSIRRGRFARLWDAFEAGSSTVAVWNNDRAYDPAYLAGDYNRYLVPGRPLRVLTNGEPVWTGFVDDLDLEYDRSGLSSAVWKSTDALGILGAMQFDAWTSSSATAGGKLTAICDRPEVGWSPLLRDFDEGVEALQSDAVSWGSSVLNYAALVARSELGYLFASRRGVLTFRDRNVTVGVVSVADFGGAGIGFQGIAATVGSELLFARVGVDREGGTNQTETVADITTWQELYGPAVRSLSITGLLLADDAQSTSLASYLLDLYDTPRYRVSELTVDITPLSTSEQTNVATIDVADVVSVEFTPNGVGDPIVQTLVVQGIEHRITVDSHVVTLSLIDAPIPYFRIGDAVYGVIGDDIIGF